MCAISIMYKIFLPRIDIGISIRFIRVTKDVDNLWPREN